MELIPILSLCRQSLSSSVCLAAVLVLFLSTVSNLDFKRRNSSLMTCYVARTASFIRAVNNELSNIWGWGVGGLLEYSLYTIGACMLEGCLLFGLKHSKLKL